MNSKKLTDLLLERQKNLKEPEVDISVSLKGTKPIRVTVHPPGQNPDLPKMDRKTVTDLTLVGMLHNSIVKQNTRTFILLFSSLIICLGLVSITNLKLDISIFFLLLVLILILAVNQFVFEYRLRKGFYGSNEYEAREILNFILESAQKGKLPKDADGLKIFSDAEALEKFKAAVRQIALGVAHG